jgi:hypothetical protein
MEVDRGEGRAEGGDPGRDDRGIIDEQRGAVLGDPVAGGAAGDEEVAGVAREFGGDRAERLGHNLS